MFNENAFRAAMAYKGVNYRELSEKLGINPSTLYRKIHNGGDFTRKEISIIVNFLGIDDPRQIFFAGELAETQEVS